MAKTWIDDPTKWEWTNVQCSECGETSQLDVPIRGYPPRSYQGPKFWMNVPCPVCGDGLLLTEEE